MTMTEVIQLPSPEDSVALRLSRPCRCGHAKGAHEHYRRGSDCSGCSCAAFHGRLVVELTVGRHAPPVVVPDEVPQPWEPYVRPTHAVGMPAERPGHMVVATAPLPRRPDEPARVRL